MKNIEKEAIKITTKIAAEFKSKNPQSFDINEEVKLEHFGLNIVMDLLAWKKDQIQKEIGVWSKTRGEDETNANGYWDKAAEIALEIGLNFKKLNPEKIKGAIYADDFGLEVIYNLIKLEGTLSFKNIEDIAYNKYQLDWMKTHNHSIKELIQKIQEYRLDAIDDGAFDDDTTDLIFLEQFEANDGFNGELYVCFDEFLNNEYQDADYMRTLLNEEEFKRYKKEREKI